jgi:hypothetical protein
MPHLGGSSKNKKKDGYRKAKREVYHAVLERLFDSVKKSQESGGFTATRVFFFTTICIKVHQSTDMYLDTCFFNK